MPSGSGCQAHRCWPGLNLTVDRPCEAWSSLPAARQRWHSSPEKSRWIQFLACTPWGSQCTSQVSPTCFQTTFPGCGLQNRMSSHQYWWGSRSTKRQNVTAHSGRLRKLLTKAEDTRGVANKFKDNLALRQARVAEHSGLCESNSRTRWWSSLNKGTHQHPSGPVSLRSYLRMLIYAFGFGAAVVLTSQTTEVLCMPPPRQRRLQPAPRQQPVAPLLEGFAIPLDSRSTPLASSSSMVPARADGTEVSAYTRGQ